MLPDVGVWRLQQVAEGRLRFRDRVLELHVIGGVVEDDFERCQRGSLVAWTRSVMVCATGPGVSMTGEVLKT